MQKPWKKKALPALLLCALAPGLLAGCGQTAPKASAVSVKTLPVQKKDVIVSKQYAGQVKALDAVSIKPKVSGTIVEKYIRSGQFVEKDSRSIRSMTGSILLRCSPQSPMWIKP